MELCIGTTGLCISLKGRKLLPKDCWIPGCCVQSHEFYCIYPNAKKNSHLFSLDMITCEGSYNPL